MKKTFFAILSLCVFAISSAFAVETNATSNVEAKEKAHRSSVEKVPACQNILNECKKLGFVVGGYKNGNGLWRNCFHPIVKGGKASLKGQEVAVAVNANDVTSCKASAVKDHAKGHNKDNVNNQENGYSKEPLRNREEGRGKDNVNNPENGQNKERFRNREEGQNKERHKGRNKEQSNDQDKAAVKAN